MANAPKATENGAPKKTKAAPVPKPIYIGLHILDENGQPTSFDKSKVSVVIATKDSGALVEQIAGDANMIVKKLDVSFLR